MGEQAPEDALHPRATVSLLAVSPLSLTKRRSVFVTNRSERPYDSWAVATEPVYVCTARPCRTLAIFRVIFHLIADPITHSSVKAFMIEPV